MDNTTTESESTSLTPLSEQLAAKAEASAASAPAELRAAFKAGIDVVRDLGIEESAKQVGDMAVDGELAGWDGTSVKLSDLWNEGPIVLMWYRGGWCPYCNIQLRAMQASLGEIENAGAKLVVLTPELPEKAKETADAANIEIVALHDKDSALAEQYGILFDLPEAIVPIYRDKLKLPEYNGSDKLQLPLAATYVIDKSGKITFAFLDADYKKRAEPADVLAAVRAAAN
jgi:peroxiredoxin